MAVEVAKQSVNYKHIPEVLEKLAGVHELLLFDRFQDIRQLGSAAAVLGIDHRILDGAEVIQRLSVCGKITASTNHLFLAAYREYSKQSLLCGNTKHIKNAASEMLTDTTVGVGEVGWLLSSGRREFQHILSALVFNGNLLAVCSIVRLAK
jgi:hypothetical protein